MLEREYQAHLIKGIKNTWPGTEVLINDPNYIQGIPDLLILFPNGTWAVLEVKASEKSKMRPNQEWYVNDWGRKAIYGGFIYPENEREVFLALHQSLASRG